MGDCIMKQHNSTAAVQTSTWQSSAIFLPLTLLALLLWPIGQYFLFHDVPPKGLKLIPGPRSTIPYIGRVHDVDPNKPWEAMKRFCNQFNGIFRLTICGEMHIWIGDSQLANDFIVKRAKVYSSRPEVANVPGSDSQGQYLPLLARDDHWRKQRRFAHVVLNHGLKQKFHGYIGHEARQYLHELLLRPNDCFELSHDFCGRVSARLGYGKPDSSAFHRLNAREFIPHISPGGSIVNLMPFLGTLPEFLIPSKRASRLRREREARAWTSLFKEARSDYNRGILPTSYARILFERREGNHATPNDLSFGFDDSEATYAIGMLVTVAIFTISGHLTYFLLAMLLHPEWQEKVRVEYDKVISDRLVEPSDSPNLPILRACLKETLRWRPTIPLGVPRLAEADDVWNGYFIPKGAVLHVVELSLSRDEKLYLDADTFRPDRWLDPGFPTYREPLTEHPRLLGHHQFGAGLRACPGVELTEMELLVACGSMIGCFELKPKVGEDGKPQWPDSMKRNFNVIGGPDPFDMDIKPRSEAKRRLIEQWYSGFEYSMS